MDWYALGDFSLAFEALAHVRLHCCWILATTTSPNPFTLTHLFEVKACQHARSKADF